MKNKKLLHTAPVVFWKKNKNSRVLRQLLQWCKGKIITFVYNLLQTAPCCFFGGAVQKEEFFTLENSFAPDCSSCSRGEEEKIYNTAVTTHYIEKCPGRGDAAGAMTKND